MRRNFMLSFAIILGLAFPAFQLNAMTISTYAGYYSAPDVFDSSTAEDGSISSQVSGNDGYSFGGANASADASGYLSVSASYRSNGYDFCGYIAEASFKEDFLNTSDDDLYYYLDFGIVNEYIHEVEGPGICATGAWSTANIQILLDNFVIWDSTTRMFVYDMGYTFTGDTDIEFIYDDEIEYYPPPYETEPAYIYAKATGSYQNVFSLGMFGSGDSFTLEYRVAAMATGMDVGIASSSFGLMGSVDSVPAPVPEPAAIFLISSGLIALVGFKKLSSVDHT